jgi:hypothetical protein
MRTMMVLGLCGCAAAADAAVMSIPASRDATLYFSSTGALANGGGENTFVGRNSQGNTRRTVIGFDVASAVPAGSTITGVTLTLNVSSANVAATDVTLHRLLADWSEGTSNPTNEGQGVASAAGDVTWLHRTFPGDLWTTPGGDFAGASAATSVGDVGLYSWSSAGMISDVQGWLDGSAGNFGWILLGDETANNTAKRFDSRGIGSAGVAPVLTVTYIPAPSAAGVLAAGGMIAMRRRRSAELRRRA